MRGPSPYSDESTNGILVGTDISSSFKTLPVGPVAGGVLAFFVFVAVSVYCYRQQTRRRHSGNCTAYGAGPGAGLRMTQLDNDIDEHDDIEPDADETTAVVTHEFSLAAGAGLDNVAIVSPYRVNTGYRRPAGGDSDHGYSTMTPHEDSEHAASYVEPLLVGRDRYRPAVRSMSTGSFSSRASSPLGPVYHPSSMRGAVQRIVSPGTLHESADELENDGCGTTHEPLVDLHTTAPPPIQQLDSSLGMTVLPESSLNQLVVPVTVHMVDTA